MGEPAKYRKKPVVIEAMRIPTGVSDSPGVTEEAAEVAKWCNGHATLMLPNYTFQIMIPTLEGMMLASSGDYVIRGVQGEFYPCKPDVFAATYEPVAHGGAL